MNQASTQKQVDYGCDDCPKLKNKRCTVWQVKVDDPHNSSCESGYYFLHQTIKA